MRVGIDESNCIVLADDSGNTVFTVSNVAQLHEQLDWAKQCQSMNDEMGRPAFGRLEP